MDNILVLGLFNVHITIRPISYIYLAMPPQGIGNADEELQLKPNWLN